MSNSMNILESDVLCRYSVVLDLCKCESLYTYNICNSVSIKKTPRPTETTRWSDRVYQDLRFIGVENPEKMAKG